MLHSLLSPLSSMEQENNAKQHDGVHTGFTGGTAPAGILVSVTTPCSNFLGSPDELVLGDAHRHLIMW